MKVAALYVAPGGPYFGLPHVDPWSKLRDARKYRGPHPVVAHPPCSRWCCMAAMNERRYGHKVGDDGGCFAAALAAVYRCGGVLEHPAYSLAWKAFWLPRPRRGEWVQGALGWSTEVHQRAYGHPATKKTWLFYVGKNAPPELDWSSPEPSATVSFFKNRTNTRRRRLKQREAAATPPAFRDVLIAIALLSRKSTKRAMNFSASECLQS